MELEKLRQLTHENTAQYVGDTFQIVFSDGSLDVQLEEVAQLRERHIKESADKREPFAMRFRGPLDPLLPQGTYAFQHAVLGGPFPLFIVPIAKDDRGYEYEAVFG